MPKLKLRNWQFKLMYNAVCEKSSRELAEVHKILCDFHNENFGCYISVVKEKAIPFLEAYKKQQLLYQTKIQLFNLEHSYALSEAQISILNEMKEKLDSINLTIEKVENGIDTIEKLDNIARVLSELASKKDIFQTYDDDPPVDDFSDNYLGPSEEEIDRLTDALIY